MTDAKKLRHIFVPSTIDEISYKPIQRKIPKKVFTPKQLRYLHAQQLEDELETAIQERIALIESYKIPDSELHKGISIELEGKGLIFDTLENRQGKNPIELLNVRTADNSVKATIFLPIKRVASFKKRIAKYNDPAKEQETVTAGALIIDSIEAIKYADLESFWMEDIPLPDDKNSSATWELWLRPNANNLIRSFADRNKIKISAHSLKFQECEICLITCSLEQLAIIQLATSALAGFRRQETPPSFFDSLEPREQIEWSHDLVKRIQPPNDDSPAVCLLDTGVKQTHDLLSCALSESDCDTFNPDWGKHDHLGHGTEMAGLALYGDLIAHLSSTESIKLSHKLESIKIFYNPTENLEELFGWITQECVSRAEINAPNRNRVFCLTVTSQTDNTYGRPTAWSASIDKISMGVNESSELEDDNKKLFVISAGNIRNLNPGDYPGKNDLEPVENPAQSWNAITVGAISHKSFSTDKATDNWEVLAKPGTLSPSSRTSIAWKDSDWLIKPDVVCEGGNRISDGKMVSNDSDLSLLTTGLSRPLTCTIDTSAAAAQVSGIAANIQAQYPNLWPETLRALIAHSASWDPEMYEEADFKRMSAIQKEAVLRRYGYGIPDLDKALHSLNNRACLISESHISPFIKEEGAQGATYHEMNLHKLPWPTDYLSSLGSLLITLKITLSYFIEPSPSQRIPKQKYSYASHGLRFHLKRPLETRQTFLKRINQLERPEGFAATGSDNWQIGSNTRNKGSLISDMWIGTAAELAEQSLVAIIPESGWWKTRKHLNRTNQKTRYSLIISLETEKQDVNIYNEIINIIRTPTVITTT